MQTDTTDQFVKLAFEIKEQRDELLKACERLMPWIGKMIADGSHLKASNPKDCEQAFQQAWDAIKKAQGGAK